MPNSLLDILYNGDYSLVVNGKSKHLGTDQKFNEDNPGLGITAEKNGLFLTAGGYKNSFSEPSYYLGGGGTKRLFGGNFPVDVGGVAGLVSGYDDTLTPMILGLIRLGVLDIGSLNLMLAPKTEQNQATLMMNYQIPIK